MELLQNFCVYYLIKLLLIELYFNSSPRSGYLRIEILNPLMKAKIVHFSKI